MSLPPASRPDLDPGETSPPPAPIVKSNAARWPGDQEIGRLARCIALLAIAGASLAQCVSLMLANWRVEFIRSNDLQLTARHRFLIYAAAGALAGLVVGLIAWRRERRRGQTGLLDGLALIAAPLTLIGLVPGLVPSAGWPDTLQLCLALTAFILAFEPLCRMHLAGWEALPGLQRRAAALDRRLQAFLDRHPAVRRWGPLGLVVLGAVAYSAYTSFYTVRNHWRFNTFNYDLGQLDNLFYNALSGRPMRCTPLIRGDNWSELRNHAEFSIYALLPFYALAPRAETLLILQSTIIGFGAIPIFRFASRRLPSWIAVCLAYSYLLYGPMHGANFFDFHFQPVAAGFILWMIDMFDERRTKLFILFYLVAIGCREDISVGLTFFGLFLVVTGHRARQGLIIAAVSAVYFVAIRFVIMPAFGQWGFQDIYRQLFPKGSNSFGGVILTMLSNPLFTFKTLLTSEKLRYILQILVPVAFLPLRRPHLWLALVPGFIFTLLTTQYGPTTEINFQYSGHFTAYIFPAAALALAAYASDPGGVRRRRAAVAALVVGTLLSTVHWGAIPPRQAFRSGYGYVYFTPLNQNDKDRRRYLAELAALVPPEAILASSDRELPHVSNRVTTWALQDGYEGSDYIIYVPNTGGRDGEQAQRALASGEWEEVAKRPALSLLKRKGAPGPLKPAASPPRTPGPGGAEGGR